jgi:hypothetical protein
VQFAAVNAFSRLPPHGSERAEVTIGPGGPGGSFIVGSMAGMDCSGFRMTSRFLYGEHYCYPAAFRVTRDVTGKLAIQDFAVDIEQLPAAGTVRYLGEAQVRKIHSEGEVQEEHLGDDPRPSGHERLLAAHANQEVKFVRRGGGLGAGRLLTY